jgi:predicted nucleic acid-binding protein
MLVVDASCVYDVLTHGPGGEAVEEWLSADPDPCAPHILDVEVFGVIRRDHMLGRLDRSDAARAVAALATWPGQRFPHQLFLERAWELRDTVRGWDAMYVALAEVLDAALLTTDRRLAAARGPTCRIELLTPTG